MITNFQTKIQNLDHNKFKKWYTSIPYIISVPRGCMPTTNLTGINIVHNLNDCHLSLRKTREVGTTVNSC